MSAATEKEIKEIVMNIIHCDEKTLANARTWKELKADSLDLVQILVALEEKYGIEISDEDAEKLKSFSEVVAYVDGVIAEKARAS